MEYGEWNYEVWRDGIIHYAERNHESKMVLGVVIFHNSIPTYILPFPYFHSPYLHDPFPHSRYRSI